MNFPVVVDSAFEFVEGDLGRLSIAKLDEARAHFTSEFLFTRPNDFESLQMRYGLKLIFHVIKKFVVFVNIQELFTVVKIGNLDNRRWR